VNLPLSVGLRVIANAFFTVQVKCLENDNELLERNEKDLKENMERLLQSREAFMKHYEACVALYICPSIWAIFTAKSNLLHCLISELNFCGLYVSLHICAKAPFRYLS
jgi:hypothetical protein